MRKLCFGGSFNPIHNGHLQCATAAAKAGGFDRVVLIPSGQPPHKLSQQDIAPAADRLALCQAVAGEDPLFEVDDLELSRSGPSYTIDTVNELRARGSKEVAWLIGGDMLRYLPHWHRALDLLRLVRFVIVARPGWDFDWKTMPAEFHHLQSHVVSAPLLPISSTEIRRRVAEHESIDGLVPAVVSQYIFQHHLYSNG